MTRQTPHAARHALIGAALLCGAMCAAAGLLWLGRPLLALLPQWVPDLLWLVVAARVLVAQCIALGREADSPTRLPEETP